MGKYMSMISEKTMGIEEKTWGSNGDLMILMTEAKIYGELLTFSEEMDYPVQDTILSF